MSPSKIHKTQESENDRRSEKVHDHRTAANDSRSSDDSSRVAFREAIAKKLHNRVEQRRKDKINIWIRRMSEILPKTDVKKESKCQILERACRLVETLMEDNEKLMMGQFDEESEIFRLTQRIKELESVNSGYHNLLKDAGINLNVLPPPTKLWDRKQTKYSSRLAPRKDGSSTSGAVIQQNIQVTVKKTMHPRSNSSNSVNDRITATRPSSISDNTQVQNSATTSLADLGNSFVQNQNYQLVMNNGIASFVPNRPQVPAQPMFQMISPPSFQCDPSNNNFLTMMAPPMISQPTALMLPNGQIVNVIGQSQPQVMLAPNGGFALASQPMQVSPIKQSDSNAETPKNKRNKSCDVRKGKPKTTVEKVPDSPEPVKPRETSKRAQLIKNAIKLRKRLHAAKTAKKKVVKASTCLMRRDSETVTSSETGKDVSSKGVSDILACATQSIFSPNKKLTRKNDTVRGSDEPSSSQPKDTITEDESCSTEKAHSVSKASLGQKFSEETSQVVLEYYADSEKVGDNMQMSSASEHDNEMSLILTTLSEDANEGSDDQIPHTSSLPHFLSLSPADQLAEYLQKEPQDNHVSQTVQSNSQATPQIQEPTTERTNHNLVNVHGGTSQTRKENESESTQSFHSQSTPSPASSVHSAHSGHQVAPPAMISRSESSEVRHSAVRSTSSDLPVSGDAPQAGQPDICPRLSNQTDPLSNLSLPRMPWLPRYAPPPPNYTAPDMNYFPRYPNFLLPREQEPRHSHLPPAPTSTVTYPPRNGSQIAPVVSQSSYQHQEQPRRKSVEQSSNQTASNPFEASATVPVTQCSSRPNSHTDISQQHARQQMPASPMTYSNNSSQVQSTHHTSQRQQQSQQMQQQPSPQYHRQSNSTVNSNPTNGRVTRSSSSSRDPNPQQQDSSQHQSSNDNAAAHNMISYSAESLINRLPSQDGSLPQASFEQPGPGNATINQNALVSSGYPHQQIFPPPIPPLPITQQHINRNLRALPYSAESLISTDYQAQPFLPHPPLPIPPPPPGHPNNSTNRSSVRAIETSSYSTARLLTSSRPSRTKNYSSAKATRESENRRRNSEQYYGYSQPPARQPQQHQSQQQQSPQQPRQPTSSSMAISQPQGNHHSHGHNHSSQSSTNDQQGTYSSQSTYSAESLIRHHPNDTSTPANYHEFSNQNSLITSVYQHQNSFVAQPPVTSQQNASRSSSRSTYSAESLISECQSQTPSMFKNSADFTWLADQQPKY